MMALHGAGTAFHTEFVPAFVSTVLYFSKSGWQTSSWIMSMSLRCVLVSTYISTVSISILIFVSWKKGLPFWKKFAPYFFYLLIMLIYLILPSVNICIQIFEMAYPPLDLKASFFESWLCFYFVVCICRIIEFFVSIRNTFLRDARIFLETRR